MSILKLSINPINLGKHPEFTTVDRICNSVGIEVQENGIYIYVFVENQSTIPTKETYILSALFNGGQIRRNPVDGSKVFKYLLPENTVGRYKTKGEVKPYIDNLDNTFTEQEWNLNNPNPLWDTSLEEADFFVLLYDNEILPQLKSYLYGVVEEALSMGRFMLPAEIKQYS